MLGKVALRRADHDGQSGEASASLHVRHRDRFTHPYPVQRDPLLPAHDRRIFGEVRPDQDFLLLADPRGYHDGRRCLTGVNGFHDPSNRMRNLARGTSVSDGLSAHSEQHTPYDRRDEG